ncbi:hypothetical protein HIM_01381 [Hirsutella minnesotensis 3608]|nr:hypothetical protein HIM_01381 [Hirsutella minnesotensis 3608]
MGLLSTMFPRTSAATVEAAGYEKVPGETIPRRHPDAKHGLVERPAEDVSTVFDIVRRSARLYGDKKAVGSRRLIKLHEETSEKEKKKWQLFELSDYNFLTYRQYEELVLQLGSGLRKIGMGSRDKLHFFAATSSPWISLAHACASQSLTIVTAYDTLGESGVEHSLRQSEASVIFVDPHLLGVAAKPIRSSGVKTVIVNDLSIFSQGNQVREFADANPDITVLTYQELRNLGQENMVEPQLPDPSDLYCIMYTSGSTGLPKGVCITHASFIAGVAGVHSCIRNYIDPKDCLLGYLPLAHILELTLENLAIFAGVSIGHGHPRTLLDQSVKGCAGDLKALRPTIMVGVPQVWESIKKAVMAKLQTSSVLRSIFWGAYAYKDFMTKNRLPLSHILDDVVFKGIKQLTGGRLRIIVNGASGLAESTRHFLSLVLAPMIVGYGLTETCGNGVLGFPSDYSTTSLSPIPAAVEMKLVSKPELGYSADASPAQGEIWIRGAPILKEYLKNPEETEKAMTLDGWFKTGDVGEFDAHGRLRIIDRVKNLIKLPNGEYIALEKVESIYRGCQSLSSVMVYADEKHMRPIAVVTPNVTYLKRVARDLDVDENKLHTDSRILDLFLKDLTTTGKAAGLVKSELVAGVIITDDEWTVQNGLLTATQKLNRKAICDRYKGSIQSCLNGL